MANRHTPINIIVASGQNSAGIIVDQLDTANNPIALDIENDGTGNSVFINTDGNASSINIDSEATSATMINLDMDQGLSARGIFITADALTIGSAIRAESTSAGLTTAGGGLGLVYFNVTNASAAAPAVNIDYAGSSSKALDIQVLTGTGSDAIFLNQDTDAPSLNIDSEATTSYGIDVDILVMTTGTGVRVRGNALTTGNVAEFYSNSSSASTRNLVEIINDHASATAATPLYVQQDAVTSTNFKKYITLGSNTIWVSDGTTPNGNLTGTAGDLCLNGPSGSPFKCTATTTWVALV